MRKFFSSSLIFLFFLSCKTPPVVIKEEPIPVIDVIKPEFEIVSIVIIQAELINTEFETVVKIDNPNEFPVALSSINYSLYGNGLLWSDGRKKDILHIPAQSSCETKFCFTMNFINMNRRLLDDIIAMRHIKYRFKGAAEVNTDFAHIQPFITSFDRAGLSEVKQITE
jgi:LEA14-like dessication related protein